MSRPSVMDRLEESPPQADRWILWLVMALLLSLGLHAGFLWWARQYQVRTFSDSYYEEIVPRAFKVDRVEIDSRLLDENPSPALEDTRQVSPVPVDLPAEDISTEKPQARAAPSKPGQIGIEKEPVPQVGISATGAADLKAATAALLDEDLNSMREALLAEAPSSAAQPAIELAAAAGRAGAGDDEGVPAGYSDLDNLLASSGGLSESQAPIFMPSDVLFGYDESYLQPEAIISLGKLGQLIQRNPRARFRIEGHTDSFGGPEYNAKLSLARAESVKQWLAGRMSIDPARIETRGLGNSRPLAPVTGSIDEQRLNRRVEIVILRGDNGSGR